MDAGLVNGLSSMVASTLPKSSTSATKSDPFTVSTVASTPVVDTVEISSLAQSAAKVFDPTAVDGPFEQKHVGGALATSSAIDGYNGWEEMLKNSFGIENGGDRNDMPVIYAYNPVDYSPDGIGPGAGFKAANQLTNEQRNFIANIYVYCHDNGLDSQLAVSITSSLMPQYWDHVEGGMYGAAELTYTSGMHIYSPDGRPGSATNNAYQSQIDSVVLETFSSDAAKDSLISTRAMEHAFTSRFGEIENHLDWVKGIQKLVYAYSKDHSDNPGGSPAINTPEGQKYMQWRQMKIRAYDAMDKIAKEDPTSFEATGDRNAPNLSEKVNYLRDGIKSFEGKYAERASGFVGSLSDGQKNILGALYELAEGKGDKEMSKVDALAKAFATSNFMEVMLLPGKDKDGNSTTNLLDMLVWTKDVPNQADFLQAVLNKKNEAAIAKVEEKLGIDLGGAKVNADKPSATTKTVETPAHIDTEA